MAEPSQPGFQFQEQISFFRQKTNLPTATWTDILHEEHDRSFVVAGALRDDLLSDFRSAVDKAISQGTTLEEFRKDFDSIVAKHGWTYNGGRNWRSRVIYETNLRTSYAAGRWAQIQEGKKARPFVRYRHNDSVLHPRPLHVAWDGLVLPVDSPWVKTHWPPNGWGCRCYIEALSPADLTKLGKTGADTPPPSNDQDVPIGTRGGNPRTIRTPEGVDPGFGYAPGASLRNGPVQAALESAAGIPASVGSQSAQAVLSIPSVRSDLAQDFGGLVSRTLDAGFGVNDSMIVGALSPSLVTALAELGVVPETSPIVAVDKAIIHALRDSKASTTASGELRVLTPEQLADLPKMLAEAEAVLLDRRENALLYIYSLGEGPRQKAKIVVSVNFKAKLANRRKSIFNSFQTAIVLDEADIAAQIGRGDAVIVEGLP